MPQMVKSMSKVIPDRTGDVGKTAKSEGHQPRFYFGSQFNEGVADCRIPTARSKEPGKCPVFPSVDHVGVES